MERFTIYNDNVNQRSVDRVCHLLSEGELVIIPTDTLYAVASDATDMAAINRICALKDINPDKQLLSIVCADLSQAAHYAKIDNRAFSVLKHYLPGPFTFILPASNKLPKVFKGRKTVGIRIPDNAVATSIAKTLDHPLLVSSCRLSGDDSDSYLYPDTLELEYEGKVAAIIEDGEKYALPSTIVDLTDSSEPVVIRQGAGEF